ncbi:MAG: metallophosphoesterase [Candidatus Hydrogenedentes bacterium]|nr:metallophosphoesterase [Candidatus Hydrogenedentota bacterium]
MLRTTSRIVLVLVSLVSGLNVDAQDAGRKPKKQAAATTTGRNAPPPSVFYTDVPERAFDIILCRPTDKSVTASIVAYAPMEGYIEYGLTDASLDSRTKAKPFAPQEPQTFELAGLQPGTRYCYRLLWKRPDAQDFAADEIHSFQTQRAPGTPFVFTIQADSHLDTANGGAIYERALRSELSDTPDFVIDLGDTFMTDKRGNAFREAQAQYFAQRYYLGLLCHSAPMFLVLGNHDGESARRFDGGMDSISGWSHGRRTSLFPNPIPSAFYSGNAIRLEPLGYLQDYYAWRWGDAQFIVLDPYWFSQEQNGRSKDPWDKSLGREQYVWLRETLERSDAAFIFVFIHNLVGGVDDVMRGGAEAARLFEWGGLDRNGESQFAARRPGWEEPIHDLLKRNGVAVVFHGHDHFFARQELDGIVYQLVPQPSHPGGRDLTSFANKYGYISGDFLSSPGYLRVAIDASTAKITYAHLAGTQGESSAVKPPEAVYEYEVRARKPR